MPSVSVRSLIEDAMTELNVLSPGESANGPDLALGLSRLNLLFDHWNAQREAVYAELFESFTLIAGQQDVTIGPVGSGADWTTTQGNRPVSLDGANLVLNTAVPNTRLPLNIRDYDWWMALRVRGVTTSIPTDLYYEPGWPLGVCHFWPIPSTAYPCELVSRGTLAQTTVNGSFSMPPGYQSAAMLTLAEDLSGAHGRQVQPMTVLRAREARA